MIYRITATTYVAFDIQKRWLCLSHVNTRFGQRILRYKGSQLWNRLPSNLTNSTASHPFRKKNWNCCCVVTRCNVMYCNEFFLELPHRLLYFKPDCTYSVDLLMTVSPLALALHMLLFVPPSHFPLPVCFVFFCLFGGQFNERMLLWQPFER